MKEILKQFLVESILWVRLSNERKTSLRKAIMIGMLTTERVPVPLSAVIQANAQCANPVIEGLVSIWRF